MSRYGHLSVGVLLNADDIRRKLAAELESRVEEELRSARIRAVAESLVQLTDGNKAITCIKLIRTAFGLGLKEAKDAYDAARESMDRMVGVQPTERW